MRFKIVRKRGVENSPTQISASDPRVSRFTRLSRWTINKNLSPDFDRPKSGRWGQSLEPAVSQILIPQIDQGHVEIWAYGLGVVVPPYYFETSFKVHFIQYIGL